MSIFQFKEFSIHQGRSALKVGTDAMLLGAFAEVEFSSFCLDIGAGTGVLSLMIAQRNETVKIDAVELDALSCMDCKQNFQDSKWSDRLTLYEQDFFEYSEDCKYDLIVSNPPFYLNGLPGNDERKNRAKHNDTLPFSQLFVKVSILLEESGVFWMICPSEYQSELIDLARANRLYLHRYILIYPKPSKKDSRVILSFAKNEQQFIVEHFTIREDSGAFRKEYIELTKDFHDRSIG